jgi:hypothetical protein
MAMQGSVVMLIALSGLGCDHKSCGRFQGPWAVDSPYGAIVDPHSFAPLGYPPMAPSHHLGGDPSGDSCGGGTLRATLWSFVLGRDPDVPTARELEASFYSGGYGQYGQLASRPNERRPPPNR